MRNARDNRAPEGSPGAEGGATPRREAPRSRPVHAGAEDDPGRRFAYEKAFDPRFVGRRWDEVEAELAAEYPAWAERHLGGQAGTWEHARRAAREAWESALDVEHTLVEPREGRWEERVHEYRHLWEARYGGSGGRWEDAEPGYRYADEMAFDPRYLGRPWDDVAPFLQSGLPAWAATHGYRVREGQSLWDELVESIRHAWEWVAGRRSPAERNRGGRSGPSREG